MLDNSEQIMRREKINLMLNPEERKIILEKAIKYGYGEKLAEYVRDACIYERLYVEEVNGKKEVCQIVSDYIVEVKKVLKIQKEILKLNTLTKSDIDVIMRHDQDIKKSINELSKTLIEILSTNSVQKHQARLRLIDKNKITPQLIDSIIDSKVILLTPSNLKYKTPRIGYAVLIGKRESIELKYINYNSISVVIDYKRELAIQNKFSLFLMSEQNNLVIYLAKIFKSEDEAINYCKTLRDTNTLVFDCSRKLILD